MEPDENANLLLLDRKRARLGEPHVAPIVALCDEIAESRRLPAGAVPYPDPEHGGTGARALFVLSHPGAAAPETRFLSLGNQDSSARLALAECERVGLGMHEIAHWNAVPFPIAESTPSTTEKQQGAPWLPRLIKLLPELLVVVLLGNPAKASWPRAFPWGSDLAVVEGPSPGRPGINRRGAKEELAAAFDEVAKIVRAAR
ncbi:hypothetical protein [Actinomycetospora sp. NBC_00405]|uniref:hypothetical protein n=1 Tax=Actinomycetospora sp. NBC_00405 TaxID=2975952 RepID=UPI002E1F2744